MNLLFPVWSPPPDASAAIDFAKTLRVPDGPYRDEPFDPSIEAPQQIIMDALDGKILDADGNPFKDFVICWATQSGKSLCAVLVPSLHCVVEKRESCVYCLPTLDLLSKVWIDKLKPSIEGVGYAKWIPEKGPGSRGGRPSSLPLTDPKTGHRAGSIIFIAGGSGKKREVGQAGVTASTILIDEADEYEDLHRVQLVKQRAAAFGADAITITASTVKKDDGSIILLLVKESTDSRLHYACPKCGKYQTMELEQIRYEGTNELDVKASARYECAHCKELLTEDQRKVMLTNYRLVHEGQSVDENGTVIGAMPRTLTFGMLCNKLDFGLGLGLPELATEHYKAQRAIDINRDHGVMRSYYRDRFSREYTADREELPDVLTNKYLAKKSARSKWAKRSVPDWVEHLFLGVDVQHDRCYWTVIGVNKGMRWAPVDWGYEYGDCPPGQTATEELRRGQLNIIRDKAITGWTIVGEEEVKIPSFNCVDVGYATDEVTKWINGQAGRWIAVRGRGEGEDEKPKAIGKKTMDLSGWGELRWIEERREKWLFCESQTVVRWMHDSLLRESGNDSAGEIPLDSSGEALRTSDAMLLHITQNVYDFDTEKNKWYWRKVHAGRRDWRDCIKYALTLAKFYLTDADKRQNQRRPKKRGIRKAGTINGKRTRK